MIALSPHDIQEFFKYERGFVERPRSDSESFACSCDCGLLIIFSNMRKHVFFKSS